MTWTVLAALILAFIGGTLFGIVCGTIAQLQAGRSRIVAGRAERVAPRERPN